MSTFPIDLFFVRHFMYESKWKSAPGHPNSLICTQGDWRLDIGDPEEVSWLFRPRPSSQVDPFKKLEEFAAKGVSIDHKGIPVIVWCYDGICGATVYGDSLKDKLYAEASTVEEVLALLDKRIDSWRTRLRATSTEEMTHVLRNALTAAYLTLDRMPASEEKSRVAAGIEKALDFVASECKKLES